MHAPGESQDSGCPTVGQFLKRRDVPGRKEADVVVEAALPLAEHNLQRLQRVRAQAPPNE